MKKFPKENDIQFNRKKFMLTIVRNPREFYLIKVLEKSCKFNAGYYITEILKPLSQWRSIEAAGNERKLLVHADNARPHTAKLSTQYFNENQMKSRHILHTPLISRCQTLSSSGMSRDVSQASRSRMHISFLQHSKVC
jgi:hypothetical protein